MQSSGAFARSPGETEHPFGVFGLAAIGKCAAPGSSQTAHRFRTRRHRRPIALPCDHYVRPAHPSNVARRARLDQRNPDCPRSAARKRVSSSWTPQAEQVGEPWKSEWRWLTFLWLIRSGNWSRRPHIRIATSRYRRSTEPVAPLHP